MTKRSGKNPRITFKGRFIGGGLFEPRIVEPGKPPVYTANIVLDAGEETMMPKIAQDVLSEKWGNERPFGLQDWTVRKGENPEYEQSYGKFFINPRSKRAPQTLRARNGAFERVTKADDLLYPGCYVAVSVGVYAYDADKERKNPSGLTFDLRAVLFLKHGERLGDVFEAEGEFGWFKSFEDEDPKADFLAM